MTDTYTVVDGPGPGYACWDRKTRAEAIAEARGVYERKLKEAQDFLATPDDQLRVRVVRGLHVQHLVEELKP